MIVSHPMIAALVDGRSDPLRERDERIDDRDTAHHSKQGTVAVSDRSRPVEPWDPPVTFDAEPVDAASGLVEGQYCAGPTLPSRPVFSVPVGSPSQFFMGALH